MAESIYLSGMNQFSGAPLRVVQKTFLCRIYAHFPIAATHAYSRINPFAHGRKCLRAEFYEVQSERISRRQPGRPKTAGRGTAKIVLDPQRRARLPPPGRRSYALLAGSSGA